MKQNKIIKRSTVLCGFGSVAAGIAKDKRMARHFKYQTHAQVLRDHPAFDWQVVIDPNPDAQLLAREEWAIPNVVSSPSELPMDFNPEVAVLATAPDQRIELLKAMPSIKAVIVEKPLGYTLEESTSFANYCEARGIIGQVNLFRRVDRTYRELMADTLHEHIGEAQAGTIIYGKGLLNNGIHMVDLTRLLFGEIKSVRALGPISKSELMPNDIEIFAALTLLNGAVITMNPIDFRHYREIAMDIWGTKGRLEIFQSGLLLRRSPLKEHRALENFMEVALDEPIWLPSYSSSAYYELYDDLAEVLNGKGNLSSSLENALRSEKVIAAIIKSANSDGEPISLDEQEVV